MKGQMKVLVAALVGAIVGAICSVGAVFAVSEMYFQATQYQ